MKNFLFMLLSVLPLGGAFYTALNYNGIIALGVVFVCGFLFGIFLMHLILNVKNKHLDIYKRELEKESIASDEHRSRVKVLESKIQVLEKALDNALKGQ